MVSRGGCSESSDAAANNSDVADDDRVQGMPSSFRVQTVSVLREGIEDIIIKVAEMIVEASIISCSQIDSSKFISSIYIDNVLHRDQLEQLLSKDIKKVKEMRLLITARDKNVHIECIIEIEVFVMRCLLYRETMDFFKAEMYNETAETNEQMHSIQIEEDSDDMWRSPKTFHYANSVYMLRRKQAKGFLHSDGRERQIECKPIAHCLLYIMKDSFLDICSFFKDPFLDICSFFKDLFLDICSFFKDPFLDICSYLNF